MFLVEPLHWSALIVFLVLALLGLWAAFSFMNKSGLEFFSIISVVLMFFLPEVTLFNESIRISMGVIFMPLVYFSLIVVSEKYKRADAQRLFYVLLATMLTLFICKFFVAAYYDSAFQYSGLLSWAFLGHDISAIIAFSVSVIATNAFMNVFPIKEDRKYLRRSLIVSIASLIDTLVFSALAYISIIQFGYIALIWLIRSILVVGVSFAVAYLRKFLNRQPAVTIEEANEKKAQEASQEEDKKEDVVVEVEEPKEDK